MEQGYGQKDDPGGMPGSGKHTYHNKRCDYQQGEGKFGSGPFPEKVAVIPLPIHIDAIGIQVNLILILPGDMNPFPADIYLIVLVPAMDTVQPYMDIIPFFFRKRLILYFR